MVVIEIAFEFRLTQKLKVDNGGCVNHHDPDQDHIANPVKSRRLQMAFLVVCEMGELGVRVLPAEIVCELADGSAIAQFK